MSQEQNEVKDEGDVRVMKDILSEAVEQMRQDLSLSRLAVILEVPSEIIPRELIEYTVLITKAAAATSKDTTLVKGRIIGKSGDTQYFVVLHSKEDKFAILSLSFSEYICQEVNRYFKRLASGNKLDISSLNIPVGNIVIVVAP
jgi:hypothetical protein